MPEGKFVAYYRVSTDKQGRSGLGLEAQQKAVRDYLNGGGWQLVTELTEVESGKRHENRPQLQEALAQCRLHKATLVIAKLDRLSRDAHFLLGLQKADIPFIACDMPHADKFTVGILALVAQKERELISERTKAALAAAKARGVKLGNPRPAEASRKGVAARKARAPTRQATLRAWVIPYVALLRAEGRTTYADLAKGLTAHGVPTPRGRSAWHAMTVYRVMRKEKGHPQGPAA